MPRRVARYLWTVPLPAAAALWLLAGAAGCSLTPTTSLDDYLRGELAAEQGRMGDALQSLTQAIEKNPQLGLAYMARGDIYKKRGDYEAAAKDFEQTTHIEPFNFDAHYQLALMYQYLQRFADAVRAYQRAVEIRPLDPDANMNLALVYTQMGEPLRGLTYAERAVNGANESPHTHANLGVLYAQTGQSDKAIEEFKRAVELNASQPEIYLNLAGEYLKEMKFAQARNVLETGLKLHPTPAIHERLGLCYYKLGDPEQAKEAYQAALQMDGNYHAAMNGLGVVLMTQSLKSTPADVGLAREALAYWRRSLQVAPDQPIIKELVDKYAGQEK